MAEAVTFELQRRDVDAFFRQIQRAEKELGKSTFSSLQWAGRQLCISLGGQTRETKQKLRPIVKNPHPDAATDNRRANFGVYGRKNGRKHFIPIYRTGEFGKHRFFDRKTMAWFDRSAGSGQWVKIASGKDSVNPSIVVPGIKTDKRRKVPWKGLAKKTWRAAKARIGSGGTQGAMGIGNLASVQLSRKDKNPSITITNKLHYATAAFQDGPASISRAMARAAEQLERKITAALAKRMGAK